jgi:hypothetical protein
VRSGFKQRVSTSNFKESDLEIPMDVRKLWEEMEASAPPVPTANEHLSPEQLSSLRKHSERKRRLLAPLNKAQRAALSGSRQRQQQRSRQRQPGNQSGDACGPDSLCAGAIIGNDQQTAITHAKVLYIIYPPLLLLYLIYPPLLLLYLIPPPPLTVFHVKVLARMWDPSISGDENGVCATLFQLKLGTGRYVPSPSFVVAFFCSLCFV